MSSPIQPGHATSNVRDIACFVLAGPPLGTLLLFGLSLAHEIPAWPAEWPGILLLIVVGLYLVGTLPALLAGVLFVWARRSGRVRRGGLPTLAVTGAASGLAASVPLLVWIDAAHIGRCLLAGAWAGMLCALIRGWREARRA